MELHTPEGEPVRTKLLLTGTPSLSAPEGVFCFLFSCEVDLGATDIKCKLLVLCVNQYNGSHPCVFLKPCIFLCLQRYVFRFPPLCLLL